MEEFTETIFELLLNKYRDQLRSGADLFCAIVEHGSIQELKLALASSYSNLELNPRRLQTKYGTIRLESKLKTLAFHAAARLNRIDILQILLQAGQEIDFLDSDGRTALSVAAEYGKDEAIQFLLDRGSQGLDRVDKWGNFPLIHAARSNFTSTVNLILKAGSSAINWTGFHSASCIHEAVKGLPIRNFSRRDIPAKIATIETLVHHGCKLIDELDSIGWRPIERALDYYVGEKFNGQQALAVIETLIRLGNRTYDQRKMLDRAICNLIRTIPRNPDDVTPLQSAECEIIHLLMIVGPLDSSFLKMETGEVKILELDEGIESERSGRDEDDLEPEEFAVVRAKMIHFLQTPIPEDTRLQIRNRIYFSSSLTQTLISNLN